MYPGYEFLMASVTLQPITIHNWKDCIALKLHESQFDFVPSNLYSIAEAQFYPEARSRAIYNEGDEMVGFLLYGRDVLSGKWKIFRLMIDAVQQRRGYGRAAMEAAIAAISRQPDADAILICYHDANQPARQLYASFGFHEQSIDDSGKVTAILYLFV